MEKEEEEGCVCPSCVEVSKEEKIPEEALLDAGVFCPDFFATMKEKSMTKLRHLYLETCELLKRRR